MTRAGLQLALTPMIAETLVFDARSEPEMMDEIVRSVIERESSDECLGPRGINVELLVTRGD